MEEVFKPVIRQLIERDAQPSAEVIADRLRPLGYDGGLASSGDRLSF